MMAKQTLWFNIRLILGWGLSVSSASLASLAPTAYAKPIPSYALGPDADQASAVMQAADAILQGEAAVESRDAERLLAAAQILSILGAGPADAAQNDLADIWARMAQQLQPGLTASLFGQPISGLKYRAEMLSGNASLAVQPLFSAGEKVTIALVSDSGSSLSIEVKNARGKPVCQKAATSRKVSCQWTPVFTDSFQILVHNHAQQSARYYLIIK